MDWICKMDVRLFLNILIIVATSCRLAVVDWN